MEGFRVVEHTVPAQHIREYPHATANTQEDVLNICAKQYIPLDNPNPRPGDVTIIAAHANGFPKELFEPLWEDLLSRVAKSGWRIRSIWATDVAHQGQSSVINESMMGNEPAWHDHSRDLLLFINNLRAEMPRPIIGIGHSMGGNQLVALALMHPRLLYSIILLDPVIQEKSAELDEKAAGKQPRTNLAQLSTFRRDLWPSREDAASSFSKSAFYKTWDKRVLQRWVQYGLRDTPTVLHPDAKSPQVTLSTSAAQEVFTYLRANYDGYGVNGKPVNRSTHADLDPNRNNQYPFYRSEAPKVYSRLPELRPGILYLFGENSAVSFGKMNKEKTMRTGVGVGGSGGVEEGRVKDITLPGVGHLIPMEDPERTADEIAEWVGGEMSRYRAEMESWKEWQSKSLKQKSGIDEQWSSAMGGPPKRAKI